MSTNSSELIFFEDIPDILAQSVEDQIRIDAADAERYIRDQIRVGESDFQALHLLNKRVELDLDKAADLVTRIRDQIHSGRYLHFHGEALEARHVRRMVNQIQGQASRTVDSWLGNSRRPLSSCSFADFSQRFWSGVSGEIH